MANPTFSFVLDITWGVSRLFKIDWACCLMIGRRYSRQLPGSAGGAHSEAQDEACGSPGMAAAVDPGLVATSSPLPLASFASPPVRLDSIAPGQGTAAGNLLLQLIRPSGSSRSLLRSHRKRCFTDAPDVRSDTTTTPPTASGAVPRQSLTQ